MRITSGLDAANREIERLRGYIRKLEDAIIRAGGHLPDIGDSRTAKTCIAGQKYGRLTIVSTAAPLIQKLKNGKMRSYRQVSWVCACGKEGITVAGKISGGRKTSCGCAQRDATRIHNARMHREGIGFFAVGHHK